MPYTLSNPRNAEIDLQTAARALDELAVMARDPEAKGVQSVHAYTRQMGRICNDFFVPFDRRYDLTSATKDDFERVAQEILAATPDNMVENVSVTLNNIRAIKGKIENAETQLDITLILVKTWELVNKIHYTDALFMFMDNLNQNVVTGGGCYPGIAARLVMPYSIFLRQAAWDKLNSGIDLNSIQPAPNNAASVNNNNNSASASNNNSASANNNNSSGVTNNNNARTAEPAPQVVSKQQTTRPVMQRPTAHRLASASQPVTGTNPGAITPQMTTEERNAAIIKLRRERQQGPNKN